MIREFPLTPSQLKALDGQRNIAVTASAGSGKTATLVERFIDLLLHNPAIGVRHILAITFTQKAAAEMRQRLATRLKKGIASATDPDERQRLAAIHADLHSARISTIHAFCASLLREYPLEAEIDPTFALLDEVAAQVMRREAVREALQYIATRPDEDPAKQALRRLLQEWERPYLEGMLDALMLKKHAAHQWSQHYLSSTPEKIFASWEEMVRQAIEPVCQHLIEETEFISQLHELATLAPYKNPDKDSAEQLIAPVRAQIQILLDTPSLEGALKVFPTLARALTTAAGKPYKASKGSKGSKANWDAEALARFRILLASTGEALAPHVDLLQQDLAVHDQRAAHLLCDLSAVFLQVHARYQHKKGEGSQLDFDDLQEKCLELIGRDNGRIGRRLAQHYRYVMVDEFQDTDLLQWALVHPLVTRDESLSADKLFIVGDPKQSIYSFRDADVAVFAQVQEAIVAANTHHQRTTVPFLDDEDGALSSSATERNGNLGMAENFRTLPVPVAFVNALFPHFMQAVAHEPFQVAYDPLVCRRTDAPSRGSVELLLVTPAEDENELDSLQREAELLARRIRQILDTGDLQICADEQLRPATAGDIAILLRRRRFLPVYEQTLRQLHIPFQVVGGLGFYQRQEIYDLANILRVLHNPRDSIALLGALRSPYFGLSDNALVLLTKEHKEQLWDQLHTAQAPLEQLNPADQEATHNAIALLSRWSQHRDRRSLVDLLHLILEDSGAWAFLSFGERGEQTVANVEKFLDLARTFTATGFRTLSDFIAHLDLLIAEEQREGEAQLTLAGDQAVQILTVHASKGLEFPIVCVPDLDGKFNLTTSDALLLDRDLGIGLSVLDPEDDFHRRPSFLRAHIGQLNQRKASAEEKRLFYVAATRARDHLLLSGRLRPEHLAPGPSPEAVRDRLSWICLGLNLTQEDVRRGEKTFVDDGETYTVRIFTDPEQVPIDMSSQWTRRFSHTALEDLLSNLETNEPAALPPTLAPVDPVAATPQFSATQLMLYERDPQEYFHRYVLALPETCLPGFSAERQNALLFGELAHAALEELARAPDMDRKMCIERLLLEAAIVDANQQKTYRSDLLTLLDRFAASTFGQEILLDPVARMEQSFALKLQGGIVTGTIDCLTQDGEDWQLFDYKTNRIGLQDLETAAQQYRRQMEIYALYLHHLYPDQVHYKATIYFNHIDTSHTLTFTASQLLQAQEEIEQLITRITRLDFPTVSDRASTFEEQ